MRTSDDMDALRDHVRRNATLQALGELSLAASQAELQMAQALHHLLTAEADGSQQHAGRIVAELRSMDMILRLLRLAMPDPHPLAQVLSEARDYSPGLGVLGGESRLGSGFAGSALNNPWVAQFVADKPQHSAADYLHHVKPLYDKQHECMHAFELHMLDGEHDSRSRRVLDTRRS